MKNILIGLIIIGLFVGAYLVFFKKAESPQVADELAGFAIPAIYPEYEWTAAPLPEANDRPFLSIQPAINDKTIFYLDGQFYIAANGDPRAEEWREEIQQCGDSEPCPFYGGDQAFLGYYDAALKNLGYESSSLNLDENLNVTESEAAYTVSGSDADGPSGTQRSYQKYEQGKMRVVVVSSSDAENRVFMSDIFTLQELVND